MRPRNFGAICVAAATVTPCGCSLPEPWEEFWADVRHAAAPTEGPKDFTEESEEEWKVVGEEGRNGEPVEVDPDQWWRKHVMSEKAREIEENLGFQ